MLDQLLDWLGDLLWEVERRGRWPLCGQSCGVVMYVSERSEVVSNKIGHHTPVSKP